MEEWKSIFGYEGIYEVSSLGRVRSLNYNHTGKIMVLKPGKNKWGYLSVILCKNREHKKFQVHRLVAMAFIPNLMNKPQVNHRNEVKTDNRVENLEWMTNKENCNYGTHIERVSEAQMNDTKRSKPVIQYAKNGEFIQEFPSVHEAERQTGVHNGSISSCCRGRIKSAGGYVWKYKFLR